MAADILLIEDSADLAFGLQRNLEYEGYRVEIAGDGTVGLERGLRGGHDLVILDVMLPGVDGLTVLQRLRARGITTPILVLTAKDGELDKVRGLRGGADDYLTKPFGVLELVARVEALLRRSSATPPPGQPSYRFGPVEVDLRSRTVRRLGAVVALTPRELDLLGALLRARGAAVSRSDLLRDVWGHRAEVHTRTVDTHVAELRRKLEPDPSRPVHIATVRKVGYRLDGATELPTEGPTR